MLDKNASKGLKYTMYNESTQVTIECTEDFMARWLARGFVVKEIKIEDDNSTNEAPYTD